VDAGDDRFFFAEQLLEGHRILSGKNLRQAQRPKKGLTLASGSSLGDAFH
jgi:hypothetical protein